MIEVSEKYQQRYKGRKGRKRLQEIAGQIEQMHRDLGNLYDGYEEMQKLESLLPDPEVRLYPEVKSAVYYTKGHNPEPRLWPQKKSAVYITDILSQK